MINHKGKFAPAIDLFFGFMEFAKGGLGLAIALFHMMGFLGRSFLVSQSELGSENDDSDLDGDDEKNGGWDADWD